MVKLQDVFDKLQALVKKVATKNDLAKKDPQTTRVPTASQKRVGGLSASNLYAVGTIFAKL